jgi:hypothetical protein
MRKPPDDLAPAGPPFQVGEEVAFFPAEIGPTSNWLRMDYAVIDDLNEEAESFGFHFVGTPNKRHAQGLENIVRRDALYDAWRAAWEDIYARTGDETAADDGTDDLWYRIVAQHPIHGLRHGPLFGPDGTSD